MSVDLHIISTELLHKHPMTSTCLLMQIQTHTMSFCQVCFDEAAYEEQNSCDCWLLTPRSVLPAVTSGSHYSRHAWKRGSDQARDEEGLFFPLLRALCLTLPGNTRGSESTSQECKLTSCRLCFSQERIGIRRYGEQASQWLGDVKDDKLMFI